MFFTTYLPNEKKNLSPKLTMGLWNIKANKKFISIKNYHSVIHAHSKHRNKLNDLFWRVKIMQSYD